MTKKEIQIIREETQRKRRMAKIFEKDRSPKYKRMHSQYLSEFFALKILMNKLNIEYYDNIGE